MYLSLIGHRQGVREGKDTRDVRYSADERREWLWLEGTREKTRGNVELTLVIDTYKGGKGMGLEHEMSLALSRYNLNARCTLLHCKFPSHDVPFSNESEGDQSHTEKTEMTSPSRNRMITRFPIEIM